MPSNYAGGLGVASRKACLTWDRSSQLNRPSDVDDNKRCQKKRCQKRQTGGIAVDFALPADLVAYLDELDSFIAREIKPIEEADDNIRFFDHRREWARTDFDKGGLPRHEWEALLRKEKKMAERPRQLPR